MDKIEKDTNLMSGKGEWNESDHPRDAEGKFTKGGGASGNTQMKQLASAADRRVQEDTRQFRGQLEQVLQGTFDIPSGTLKVGSTPKIFIEKAGLPDLPLVMSYETAYLSMNSEGTLKGNYHSLGIDTLSQLPSKLQNPLYIFESDKPKRVEAVVDLVDKKGRNVFVSVEMDTVKPLESKYQQVNLVITAFSPRNSYIQRRLEENKVLYKKEN